ncbi:unnamed protein product [Anisakis simplex]|uniref:Sorbitol dehydrogenase n=1 Tax=Anisakis simplex TaxID=6269 RepID=A0A0M3J7F1_ANISI|nr:unnamed protein product [Anisakis simplex]
MEEGSLVEPLSVAVHACRRANVQIGQKVLILGAGPIGLVNMMTAKAMGASKVLMTDIVEKRLELAKQLGADYTLNVSGLKPEEAANKIVQLLGMSPDCAIECTGVTSSIETSIHAVKSSGTLVVVGMGSDRVDIPIIVAAAKELDIRGIFRYVNCYPTAIEMIASGKVDLKGLTKAHYKLEESQDAFNRFLKGDVIKIFIQCDETS